MQVAPGRQARRARQADLLALADLLADRHAQHRQVRVAAAHPVLVDGAVVDLDQQAVTAGVAGAGDGAVGHRDDRGAAGGRHVDAVVVADVVQDRVEPRAVGRGDRAGHRRHVRRREQGGRVAEWRARDQRQVQVRQRDAAGRGGDPHRRREHVGEAQGSRGAGTGAGRERVGVGPHRGARRPQLHHVVMRVGDDGGRGGDGGLHGQHPGEGDRQARGGREGSQQYGRTPTTSSREWRGAAMCALHQFPRGHPGGEVPGGE